VGRKQRADNVCERLSVILDVEQLVNGFMMGILSRGGVVDNIAALILGSGDDILIIRWASVKGHFHQSEDGKYS
jgi:hypothetical protein